MRQIQFLNCSWRRRERARHQLKKRRGKEDEDQNIPVGNVMEVDRAGSRRATHTRSYFFHPHFFLLTFKYTLYRHWNEKIVFSMKQFVKVCNSIRLNVRERAYYRTTPRNEPPLHKFFKPSVFLLLKSTFKNPPKSNKWKLVFICNVRRRTRDVCSFSALKKMK